MGWFLEVDLYMSLTHIWLAKNDLDKQEVNSTVFRFVTLLCNSFQD